MNAKLTKSRAACLRVLANGEWWLSTDVAQELRLHPSGIGTVLSTMSEPWSGRLLTRNRSGGRSFYQITEAGRAALRTTGD